jgi:dihydrodipicolinate synthase/N-acetylneuraminate lyase
VEKVFPEIVSHGADGFLSVSYNHLVAGVIEAVKEFYYKWLSDSKAIHREIASVKAETAKLEAENAARIKR